MPIIVSKNGKNAIRLEKSDFKKEAELQKYIMTTLNAYLLKRSKRNALYEGRFSLKEAIKVVED